MESFNASALWDLSLPPSLPSLADDEFIALLQKQFGANNAKEDSSPIVNIDPQNLSRVPPVRPIATPPSEDSSPSPPSASDLPTSRSRRESGAYGDESYSRQSDREDDPDLKRKASEDDLEDEPSHKSQHRCPFPRSYHVHVIYANLISASSKMSSAARRKSTGNSNTDESRLLKRKEQNRAAQRAFRERKEKHVKDLEDKVAALEEKNTVAVSENESLREVITRLQDENIRLRSSSFTFSVPASSSEGQSSKGASRGSPSDSRQDTSMNLFNSPATASTSASASTHDSPQNLFVSDKNDSPLSFLGPGLTVVNPDQRTATATADAMGMDFGFGPTVTSTPYTTIASNPLFMSFREPDPFDPLGHTNQAFPQSNQSFDFSQQLFPGWPDVAMDGNNVNGMQAFDLTNSLDELFGSLEYNGQGMEFMNVPKASPTSSLSPVSHQNMNNNSSGTNSGSSSSGSSPASIQSSGVSPGLARSNPGCDGKTKCTKENLAKFVAQDSGSMFAPRSTPSYAESDETSPAPVTPPPGSADDSCSEFPPCKGLQLPKTQKSEKNVEVMNAWRTIRHDPKYQSVDINQLCTEFASKAKCDGCQVVIEPSGMEEILETVEKSKKAKKQGNLFTAGNSAAEISSVMAK
ncbi:hypothetical protein DFH11DRAFT_1500160 [Phellopilus nigrolimitatus]|nr:hypothetical protein DFH11DRAFT_1500160 [Phellopilus nigrolimitatus]